jgi:hypothetical protein
MSKTATSPRERFFAKVDASGGPDACHRWLGAKARGVGLFYVSGSRNVSARRFALELTEAGPPSPDLFVRVTCGTPDCVNPAHLSVDMPTEERFWCHVDKRGPDDCWNWKASRVKGYGQIRISETEVIRAHRVAWEYTRGPIPDGLFACHKCDNPSCCNPSHLFLGTAQDNADDKVAKGRQAKGARCKPHRP